MKRRQAAEIEGRPTVGRSRRPALIAAVRLAIIVQAPVVSAGDDGEAIRFDRDVRPILATYCLECHGPDSRARKGRLRFDDRDSVFRERRGRRVVDRESPAKSELLVRVASDDDDTRMPPPDSPRQPSAAEIDVLRRWVESGAPWEEHWAFLRPVRPAVPVPRHRGRVRNPIDAFVFARLEAEGLQPSPRADPVTLLRRLSLTLTGLPPSPAEVDAYLADASSESAYLSAIERLLASPRYGEHFAMDWLDAARYADTSGYQADWERFMWPWRDWVVDALNSNLPFDQFTVEQLAGDLLPEATTSQLIATGFNRNHRVNDEGGSLDEEFEVEYVVDRVDTTATVWLGLSAGCARCHDHKYDPITQREFYQLYAFFDNVPEKGIDGRKGAARPFIEVPDEEARAALKVARERLAELRAADSTSQQGVEGAGDIRALEKEVRRLEKRATVQVQVMEERSERQPTYLLMRGAYDRPDRSEALSPALPAIFGSLPTDTPANRLALARWIVGPENPLTARVIVNRIWQHWFGTGLVRTSEDFGTRGERPSHPELLDWLATEFVRRAWDLKAMHRLIAESATFQQASRVGGQLGLRDPENRLLARGPRRRLSGAAIRDQALFVSGLLSPKVGGPPVKPYQPPGLWKELSFATGKTSVDFYVQDHGESLYRRSLYTFWKRSVAPPRLAIFDGGGREACRVRSGLTNTPMQALVLQNDVTFVEAARHLAERLLIELASEDDAARIVHGWRLVLSRRPDEAELAVLLRALERYRRRFRETPQAAAALLEFGEAERDARLDPVEHAALTLVAQTLLNLDEAITRE